MSMSTPTKIIYLITFLISTTLIHNFKHFVLSPETERAFDSTITIYPYSRPSIQESGILTIMTFGDCRVNETQVDIECSVAIRDLIDRGPYLTGYKGTGEERWVLGRLWWLRVGFHIFNASLVLSCIAVYLAERTPRFSSELTCGSREIGLSKVGYRKLAILFCSIASMAVSLVSVISLSTGKMLSETLLGSSEYPDIHSSFLSAASLIYATLWYSFVYRADARTDEDERRDYELLERV